MLNVYVVMVTNRAQLKPASPEPFFTCLSFSLRFITKSASRRFGPNSGHQEGARWLL